MENSRSIDSHGNYESRLSRVTSYLHAHLDEELDLNKLAEIACMSPYHWHRIYQAVHGESVVAAVKRLRLQRAATTLCRTEMTVEQIAKLSGYTNLQSFTRIFSSVYGMPPARYRKQGSHTQFPSPSPARSTQMYTVEVKNIPSIPLICVEHSGPYMGIAQAFDILKGCASSRNLFREDTRWLGVFLDDPCLVEPDKLRSQAGISLPLPLPENALQEPLIRGEIKGGKYAVLHYKGPYSDMAAVYQWLYGSWLPGSGQEAADAPVFEEYLNNPRDTAPPELLTEICLPLR